MGRAPLGVQFPDHPTPWDEEQQSRRTDTNAWDSPNRRKRRPEEVPKTSLAALRRLPAGVRDERRLIVIRTYSSRKRRGPGI